MRKLLVLVLVSVLVFGCKKDEVQEPINNEATISFQVDLQQPTGEKAFDCPVDANGDLLEPDYAEIVIDGVTYWPLVFRIDGILYTQNIKLMLPTDQNATTVDVQKFVLWDDGGTETVPINDPAEEYGGPTGTLGDDVIVMATPLNDAHYNEYINSLYQLDYTINVAAFEKFQFPIEVLCFVPDDYSKFGFDWFTITEIVVREQCFFGDICIKDLDDYDNSWYENQQPNGLQLDMPALMQITVYREGVEVPHSPFTNADAAHYWGVGEPLCIEYPDYLNQTDNFTAVIEIYVADGDAATGFGWVEFATLDWIDDEDLEVLYGTEPFEGIFDLVLGECNFNSTDLQLVPYQNLPAECDMQTSSGYAPGPAGTYFDVTLSNILPGPGPYDIEAGTYGVYCGDQDATIYVPKFYPNTDVYGSLFPGTLPATMPAEFIAGVDNANWLMNNLDNYTGEEWNDIQWALWLLMDDSPSADQYVPGPSTLASQMAADAVSYGDGYLPPPGGWAAVIFHAPDPTTGAYTVQVVFTFVDP